MATERMFRARWQQRFDLRPQHVRNSPTVVSYYESHPALMTGLRNHGKLFGNEWWVMDAHGTTPARPAYWDRL
jgi:hypothetical protein